MTRVDSKKFKTSQEIPARFAGVLVRTAILAGLALAGAGIQAAEQPSITDSSGPTIDEEVLDGTATASRDSADETLDETSRDGAYARMARLAEEERYEEASAAAFQVLRLTQEAFGPEALEVAAPLVDIAVLQQQLEQFSDAETNLTTAIVVIETHDGPLSPRLVAPLRILGNLYIETDQPNQALQTFKRSLRVNQVNHGFTDFGQFPIMDGLTNSYAKLGEFEDAAFYQQTQLEIHQRKFGETSPETAPGYHKLARWYRRNLLYDDARLLYQRADRLIKKAYGEDSPERAAGLRGLARVYLESGNSPLAANTLRKVMVLGDETNTDDLILQANAQISLGDVYQRQGKYTTATEQYVAAWNKLSQSEQTSEEREATFAQPVWLEGRRFLPRYASRSTRQSTEDLETGYVLIGYDVSETGRVVDARVIESEPAGLMDKTFVSIYRRSKYRPRYMDGSAVSSEGLVRRHEFQYEPKPDKDKKQDREKSAPFSRGRLENPND